MPLVQRESVNRFTEISKTALAALLIAWVFFAAFVSSGHHLHHAVHHDSEHATHHCAISLFERGHTLYSDPVRELAVSFSESTEIESIPGSSFTSSFKISPHPARGPPA
jgi:hypothetical protein